jgi:hypothetical protein
MRVPSLRIEVLIRVAKQPSDFLHTPPPPSLAEHPYKKNSPYNRRRKTQSSIADSLIVICFCLHFASVMVREASSPITKSTGDSPEDDPPQPQIFVFDGAEGPYPMKIFISHQVPTRTTFVELIKVPFPPCCQC